MAAALTTEFRATATPPWPSSILSRLEAGRGSAVRTWAAGCMTASSTNRDEQDRTKRHRSYACERIACLTMLCQAHRTRSSHCSYVPSNLVYSVYTGKFITPNTEVGLWKQTQSDPFYHRVFLYVMLSKSVCGNCPAPEKYAINDPRLMQYAAQVFVSSFLYFFSVSLFLLSPTPQVRSP